MRRRCPSWDSSDPEAQSSLYRVHPPKAQVKAESEPDRTLCQLTREGLRLAWFSFFSPAHLSVLAKDQHCTKSDCTSNFKEVCVSP